MVKYGQGKIIREIQVRPVMQVGIIFHDRAFVVNGLCNMNQVLPGKYGDQPAFLCYEQAHLGCHLVGNDSGVAGLEAMELLITTDTVINKDACHQQQKKY